MNKKLILLFKSFSVLRLLCIPVILILEKLWLNSIPNYGPFRDLNIDFELEWWAYAIGILIAISFPFNTVVGLLISFRPKLLFSKPFSDKLILKVFYGIELLLVPFYIIREIQAINDAFIPRRKTQFDIFAGLLFNNSRNDNSIEKMQVINFGILVLCSLVFVSLFWLAYKERKKSLGITSTP